MKALKIIAFAGLPLTGKTTLAKLLEGELKIVRLDIDEIRNLLFKHNPVDSETDRELDGVQMWASWKSLFALADCALEAGDSVIIVGTFSRETYYKRITSIAEIRKATLKVVFCHASDEVIAERIEQRKQDKENPSNLRSVEGYHRVKARYVKMSVPNILNLDTSCSTEKCLSKIKEWI